MSSQNQPPPQAVANLPVVETLTTAFAATYGRPGLLLRAATGGLLLLAATAAASLALPPNPFTLMLMVVAPFAAYSHFGVNWYRIMLLGPEGLVRPTLRWDRRHWRFLGYGLALAGVLLVINVLLSLALPFAGPVITLCLLYLAARCSFLFPTISVEEPYSFAFSWQHTQGQGLRLTAALLIAGLPLLLSVVLLSSLLFTALFGLSLFEFVTLPANGGPPTDGALSPRGGGGEMPEFSPLALLSFKMISEALCMAALAPLFSIVAIAFRTCTGWVPAGPGNLPAAPDATQDNGPDDRSGGA